LNVKALLTEGRSRLAGSPAGGLEAEILLGAVLDVRRDWIYANSEHPVSPGHCEDFRQLVERRKTGEPIAYLTGRREFWSLSLEVTPDVLIPRHETELLVETALDFIPTESRWRIVDLGTGSGAVALALAVERPLCEVHATDISEAALKVAQLNAQRIAAGRITFHRGPWLEPLRGRFQVILSNPPYIASDDAHLQRGDCRFEPGSALTPGRDGLSAIRTIAGASLDYLETGGLLVLEHGFEQGHEVRTLLKELDYREVKSHRDLENRERVTTGRKA
jgi:release factor glutamine methyltransferase